MKIVNICGFFSKIDKIAIGCSTNLLHCHLADYKLKLKRNLSNSEYLAVAVHGVAAVVEIIAAGSAVRRRRVDELAVAVEQLVGQARHRVDLLRLQPLLQDLHDDSRQTAPQLTCEYHT